MAGKGKIVAGVMDILKGETRVGKFIGKATKQVKAIRRVRAIKKARKIRELDEAERLAGKYGKTLKNVKGVKGGKLGKLTFAGGGIAAGVSWLTDTVGDIFGGKHKEGDFKTEDQLEQERQAAARERDRLREQKNLRQKGLAKVKTERELVEKRLDELRTSKTKEELAIQRLNLLLQTSFTNLDKLQSDRSRLEEQNDSIKEEMMNPDNSDSGTSSGDNSGVVSEIRDNQNQTDSIQTNVDQIQAELDDRRERLNRIQSEINELEGREADIDSAIDELEDDAKADPQKPVIDAVKGYASSTMSVLDKVLTGMLLAPAVVGIIQEGFEEVKGTIGGWFNTLWDDIGDLFEAAFSNSNEDDNLSDEEFAEKLEKEAEQQASNDKTANLIGTGANVISGLPFLSATNRAVAKGENKMIWDWASSGGWKPLWMKGTTEAVQGVGDATKVTLEGAKAVKTAEEVAVGSKAAIEGERLAANMLKTTEGMKLAATGSKIAEKSIGKTVLKRLPFVGLAIGGGLGVMRASEGDYTGAALETLSGIAQLADFVLPGLGTVASLLIDGFIAMRDMDYDKALQQIAEHELWKLQHARELESMTKEEREAYNARLQSNMDRFRGRDNYRSLYGGVTGTGMDGIMAADATRVSNPQREMFERQLQDEEKRKHDEAFRKTHGGEPTYWDRVDPGSIAFDLDTYMTHTALGAPMYRNDQYDRARKAYNAEVIKRRSTAPNAMMNGKSIHVDGMTGAFATGGYTGEGDPTEAAGVVHKGEYVVPSSVLNNPEASPMVDELEKMRQRNSGTDIPTRRSDDITTTDAKKNRYLAELGFLQAFNKIQSNFPDIDSCSQWEFEQAKRVFISLPFIGLILKRGGLMSNISHYNWKAAIKEYLNITTMVVNEVEACLGGVITAYYNYLYTGNSDYVNAALANANTIIGSYSKRSRARLKKSLEDRLNETDATLLKQLEDLANSGNPTGAPMNDMQDSGNQLSGSISGFSGVTPDYNRVGTIIEGSAPIYSQLNLDIKGAGRKNNNPGNNIGMNPFAVTSNGVGGSGNSNHTAYSTLEDGYAGNAWVLLNYLSGKSRYMKANPTLRNIISTWVDGQPQTGPQFSDSRIARYEADSGIKADTPIPLTEDNLLRLVLTIGKHDSSYINPSQARIAVRRAIQKWKELGNGDIVSAIGGNSGFSIVDSPSERLNVFDQGGSYRFGSITPWANPESTPITQGGPGGQYVAAVRMSPAIPLDSNNQYRSGEYDDRFKILENKMDAVLAMGFDTNISVKSTSTQNQGTVPPMIARPTNQRTRDTYRRNLG